MTQQELFAPDEIPAQAKPRKSKTATAPDALRVNWGGKNYALDGKALDALESECGPCEDENGVSLWRILRDVKAHGARRVQFI